MRGSHGSSDRLIRVTRRSTSQGQYACASQEAGEAIHKPPTFQEVVQSLQGFWGRHGCVIQQPYNTEVGAGTMNPATFLRVLGPEPWNVAYVEPSVRPDDSRFGVNPNRVQQHTQFQVLLKPEPGNAQELFLASLEAIGVDLAAHDVRFVEDNWESPVLGAWGLGWEVWLDGMEVTQFTYFQQAGSIPLECVATEITYGLERILMALQRVNHFKDVIYTEGVTLGDLFLENEIEMSSYNIRTANVRRVKQLFDIYIGEAQDLISAHRLPIPAYNYMLKASHAFNVLDARGAVSFTDRSAMFSKMRGLVRLCSQLWLSKREDAGYPLLNVENVPVRNKLALSTVHASTSISNRNELFLLELGMEECPPAEVDNTIAQLARLIESLLSSENIQHGNLRVAGTPRRLAVLVMDVPSMLDSRVQRIRGPPAALCIGPDGAPTQAALGFCKKNGVSIDDCKFMSMGDGSREYLCVDAQGMIRSTQSILVDRLPDVLGSISFSKKMRWEKGSVAWSRPVRWVTAMFGEDVLDFEFAGVRSGRTTFGMRCEMLRKGHARGENNPLSLSAVAAPPLSLSSANEYEDVMSARGIVLDVDTRERFILDASEALAAAGCGGRVSAREKTSGIFREIANLVEAPKPLLGRFDPAYLDLPREVLETVMRKHQRYIPLEDNDGKLIPAFIAVANGNISSSTVVRGNEAVLRARYADAAFFFESDKEQDLSAFRPALDGTVFHVALGTMLDKSLRVELLALELARILDEAVVPCVVVASPLVHADLCSAMVTEFTSLAGTMGSHYARHQGCAESVCQAIFEMSLPRYSQDSLPRSPAGIILSAAERLDTIAGMHTADCIPTSSSDPYAVRRACYGLVDTLVASKLRLDLRIALRAACTIQPVRVRQVHSDSVTTFVQRRLEQKLLDHGFASNFVRGVLTERGHDPWLCWQTVETISNLSKTPAGRSKLALASAAHARAQRITSSTEETSTPFTVDPALFVSREENGLWLALGEARGRIYKDMPIAQFLDEMHGLESSVALFFENCLVMDPDDNIKRNRLHLCQMVADLQCGIVDLSELDQWEKAK